MNIPKISAGAWIRTIVLIITLLNGALAMFGKQLLPINEDDVTNAVNTGYAAFSAIAVIGASLASWWKDNDFTKKARIAKEQIKTQNK
jgi:SPP1 family holin